MLTLNELVDFYSIQNSTSKSEAKRNILMFIETVKMAAVEKGGVDINGFIKVEVVEKPERECMNPQTQEKFIKPKTKRIKVSAKPAFAKILEEK